MTLGNETAAESPRRPSPLRQPRIWLATELARE